MSENTHVYIGTLPCGCHVAAAVDVIDNKKHTARWVRDMITDGLTVSRRPLTELRDGTIKLSHCTHKNEPEQGTLL